MANRINLREFQQALNARIANSTSQQQQISTLAVLISGQHWLVDMADISEVLEPLKITAIPLGKPWALGMINVRGVLYCVSDIAAYLQHGKTVRSGDNRLLLVADRFSFNAALLVDRVLGLRDMQQFRQDGERLIDEHNVVWQKLDVASLLQQTEFLQIGA
ncbi:MAG: chemotaxis protein CheW [Gallionella sp.]